MATRAFSCWWNRAKPRSEKCTRARTTAVAEHLETLPRHTEQSFVRYLDCGVLGSMFEWS
jgi:hypothetical protein